MERGEWVMGQGKKLRVKGQVAGSQKKMCKGMLFEVGLENPRLFLFVCCYCSSSSLLLLFFSYFMTLPGTVIVVGLGVRVHGGGGEGKRVAVVRITVAMNGSHGDGRCR